MSDTRKLIKMNQAQTSHQYSPGWVRDDQQRPEQWQSYQAQQEQDIEAVKRENLALKQMNNQLLHQIGRYKGQHASLLKLYTGFQSQHVTALEEIAKLELQSSNDYFHIAKLRKKLDSFGIFEFGGKSDHIAS